MQCPGLNFLEIFTFFLMLLVVICIIYFLIRKFNKSIKFKVFLKVILLYYLCAVILYSIFKFTFPLYFIFLKFLLFSTILFVVFYFITRKEFLISWKKSLAIFLVMSFILFPILDYLRTSIEFKILTLPFFEKQKAQWEPKNIQTKVYCSLHVPLPIKIRGNIEGGIASWFNEYLLYIKINNF